jgi:hypothetical protein
MVKATSMIFKKACNCKNCTNPAPYDPSNDVGFFNRPFLGICLGKKCRDFKEEKLDLKLDRKQSKIDARYGKTEANLLLAQQGIDGTNMNWLGESLGAVSQAIMGIMGGGVGGGLGGIFGGGTNTGTNTGRIQQQEQQRQMLVFGGVAVVFIIILIAVFNSGKK